MIILYCSTNNYSTEFFLTTFYRLFTNLSPLKILKYQMTKKKSVEDSKFGSPLVLLFFIDGTPRCHLSSFFGLPQPLDGIFT